ncbi:MAG: hypothetical protein JJU02_10290 [Cryomorphaceae bacterium]|nr:hypothetical protein [Cryomorphaceae bacterium]
MRHTIYSCIFLLTVIFSSSCQPDDYVDTSQINAKVNTHRFDEAFFALDTTNFTLEINKMMQGTFAPFFEGNSAIPFWKSQRTLEFMIRLHGEVSNKYPNLKKMEDKWTNMFKHYRYYFPKTPDTLHIYTYISGLDFDFPIIYVDSLQSAFISLDLFLGKDHPAYAKNAEYLNFRHDAEQLPIALARELINQKIRYDVSDMSFINEVIFHGKKLYALEKLIPGLSERELLNYNEDHIVFCVENERIMWRFFIEQDIIFNQQGEYKRRFIEPAPFSKFYMEFDNQTPGQVGQWIGWQIVKKYMKKHPGKELSDLLKEEDHRGIFAASGYKP